MPDELLGVVRQRTRLEDRYLTNASHQSMSYYLTDWQQAYERLGRQLEVLRRERDARLLAATRGLWPPVVSSAKQQSDGGVRGVKDQ